MLHRRDFLKATLAGVALASLSAGAALAGSRPLRMVAYGPEGALHEWLIPRGLAVWADSPRGYTLSIAGSERGFEFEAVRDCTLTDLRLHDFAPDESDDLIGEVSRVGASLRSRFPGGKNELYLPRGTVLVVQFSEIGFV